MVHSWLKKNQTFILWLWRNRAQNGLFSTVPLMIIGVNSDQEQSPSMTRYSKYVGTSSMAETSGRKRECGSPSLGDWTVRQCCQLSRKMVNELELVVILLRAHSGRRRPNKEEIRLELQIYLKALFWGKMRL